MHAGRRAARFPHSPPSFPHPRHSHTVYVIPAPSTSFPRRRESSLPRSTRVYRNTSTADKPNGTDRHDPSAACANTCYTPANSGKDPPTIMQRASGAPLDRNSSAAPSPRSRTTRPASLTAVAAVTLLLAVQIALIACGDRAPTHTPTPANTYTPIPTNTPAPTHTPTPTNTHTPIPTNAPATTPTSALGLIQLTDNSFGDGDPAWSPDGSKMPSPPPLMGTTKST